MKRSSQFLPHSVNREERADGTVFLRSNYEIGPVAKNTGDWLHHWAENSPGQIFIAERSGAGWREETYISTLQKVQNIGAALLGRGMRKDTPILIVSGNSVDHGLLSLAAQYVGIPTVPVAEQYSLIEAAHLRLKQAVDLVRPKMVFASDANQFGKALSLEIFKEIEIVTSNSGALPTTSFSELLKGHSGVDIAKAHATVTPDSVAKILMTSGSTSAPKGVLTTQKMMCANQTQIADTLPFLRERTPRILDWLPWNHVFGGSHNFNMMLSNGGSLYLDEGKPAPKLFHKTIENLGIITGTLCFNVPVGFQLLMNALQADKSLQRRFFEDLDLIFYAGASLPQEVWEGFENMAMDINGEVPLMTSSWGLTETAPATLLQQEPTNRSGVVGVPVPDVTVKLIPMDEERFEIRVKGPNIMPGYFNDPIKTAKAFDVEEYFITGDAMKFVDPKDVNKGLKFDGRTGEDFKLLTGTWVRAAQLRMDLLTCLAPLADDLVITGADRDQIGLMIFPNMTEFEHHGIGKSNDAGAMVDSKLLAEIQLRLEKHAKGASSSTRIARAIVLEEPASMPEGEMTAKGNLNFRKILTRRADMLARLYCNTDPAVIKL